MITPDKEINFQTSRKFYLLVRRTSSFIFILNPWCLWFRIQDGGHAIRSHSLIYALWFLCCLHRIGVKSHIMVDVQWMWCHQEPFPISMMAWCNHLTGKVLEARFFFFFFLRFEYGQWDERGMLVTPVK